MVTARLREDTRSSRQYAQELRAAAHALWQGGDVASFEGAIISAVNVGFGRAWLEGARECGIGWEDLTIQEKATLDEFIWTAWGSINGFAEFIVSWRDRRNPRWAPIKNRLAVWINRYDAVRVKAAAMACGNKKKIWQYGATIEHCRSCSGFVGRVYRYRTWEQNGALPKSSRLHCNGYRCDCGLHDTDLPITPGRFPASLLK